MSSTPNPHLALAAAAEQRANAHKHRWTYREGQATEVAQAVLDAMLHALGDHWLATRVRESHSPIEQLVSMVVDSLVTRDATIAALQAKLTEALNEVAKWRRIRNNSHGPCCQCQHCGRDYDECRCDLDGVADELEQAKAKLTEALALAESGYREGYYASEPNMDWESMLDDFYANSQTRAAVERLRGDVQ